MEPHDATEYTRSANEAQLEMKGLDWEDRQDWDFASRGFMAKLPGGIIRDESGRAVWDLEQYSFLDAEQPPPTVNPSLWRQARLNMLNGLFKVTDRIYQVRGHDLSVISFIEGATGWIVIDPLISAENARASLGLLLDNVERRPVTAVIYTHSHIDHFGGVKGVTSLEDVEAGKCQVIAPEGFLEAAVSENVTVGAAMGRRASYMYGSLLPRGPRGQVDAALGKMTSSGTVTLIPPTDYISETGTRMKVDGVNIEFQVTPNTEAPAEMNFFFPDMRSLCMAENCSHNLHNILTLRGAQVRDASAWAHYLGEALGLFASDSELVFTSHHWPVWGKDELIRYIRKQRDMYRYLHDQTVRMMNKGCTGIEIAETLELPRELAREWFNRGYYGSISHNVKAIYQKYLGWFDGNPANLHPLPPVEAGRKYVEYMGGADVLLSRARKAYEDGEYRWVVQVVNHLVFSEPDNEAGRMLQADALEQLGYQSENATWRNFYLTGAMELRDGVAGSEGALAGAGDDLLLSLTPEMVFDYMAVHIDPEKAEGKCLTVKFVFTDTGEQHVLEVENCVLNHSSKRPSADADVTLKMTRGALAAVISAGADRKPGLAAAGVEVEGDKARLLELFSLFDLESPWFNIVTP